MRVRIDRTKMAMPGSFYAYDVAVPVAECPWISAHDVTTIIKDGKSYYSFADAALPESHWKREKGWERYQAHVDNDKRVGPIMLGLVKQSFPETAALTEWPTLWVELPKFTGTRATKENTWE